MIRGMGFCPPPPRLGELNSKDKGCALHLQVVPGKEAAAGKGKERFPVGCFPVGSLCKKLLLLC